MQAALDKCAVNGWAYEIRHVSYQLIASAYPKMETEFFNVPLMLESVINEDCPVPYTTLFDGNTTFAMVKPDASDRFDQIETMPEFKQFQVLRRVRVRLSRAQAELFYEGHKDGKFFKGLVDFMVSGPVPRPEPRPKLAGPDVPGVARPVRADKPRRREARAFHPNDHSRRLWRAAASQRRARVGLGTERRAGAEALFQRRGRVLPVRRRRRRRRTDSVDLDADKDKGGGEIG